MKFIKGFRFFFLYKIIIIIGYHSSYDIQGLEFPIIASLEEDCCSQGTYQTKTYKWEEHLMTQMMTGGSSYRNYNSDFLSPNVTYRIAWRFVARTCIAFTVLYHNQCFKFWWNFYAPFDISDTCYHYELYGNMHTGTLTNF